MCSLCGNRGRVEVSDEEGVFYEDCPNGCCSLCRDGGQHGRGACPLRIGGWQRRPNVESDEPACYTCEDTGEVGGRPCCCPAGAGGGPRA